MAGMLERKLRNYFRRLDFDQDGLLSKKDFVSMAERFCDLENADPGKREKMVIAFTELAGIKGEESVTESTFSESFLKQPNNPELLEKLTNMLEVTLSILNTTEDGYLQYDEYNRIFVNVGITNSADFTRKAFDAIDNDHDGKLSFDELFLAVRDFFTSEDENSPLAIIMGPL